MWAIITYRDKQGTIQKKCLWVVERLPDEGWLLGNGWRVYKSRSGFFFEQRGACMGTCEFELLQDE